MKKLFTIPGVYLATTSFIVYTITLKPLIRLIKAGKNINKKYQKYFYKSML